MVVCETWLANDFLVRVGCEPGVPCGCPDCPAVEPVAAPVDSRDTTLMREVEADAWS
jgi:hypothetical protein